MNHTFKFTELSPSVQQLVWYVLAKVTSASLRNVPFIKQFYIVVAVGLL